MLLTSPGPVLRPLRLLAPLSFACSLFVLSGNALAANVDADCAALYGSNFSPVIGQVAAAVPAQARPLKGVRTSDPAFGTCVYRATDHAVEAPNNFARNDYSRRQAFNADNTRFIVYASGGGWHMYDANTLNHIRQLGMSGDAEPQWHPTDPKTLHYVPSKGGTSLRRLNVETNTSVVAADFTGKLPWSGVAHIWTRSEGSPSADGRYWCFMAESSTSAMLGVFTYDLQTQTVIGTRSMSTRPNHVSMSPSGRYCVISGTTAWNPTFTASRTLLSGSQHNDLAIGANGNDHYVFANQAGDGYLTMKDIETGLATRLIPTWIDGTTTSMHISAKAFSRPGWIVLSTFNHSGALKWAHERVMAIELNANPKIINLAHHHGYYNGYWTQPQASVSRDFSRVLVNSNWGSTSDMDVDAYLLRLSDNLFGTTTTTDSTAPTVSASAAVSSTGTTLAAIASDNVGVVSVDFMVDGVLKGSDATAPYSMALPAGSLVAGNHSLVAVAYDKATNAGSSAPVAFTIDAVVTPPATSTDTTAPTVSAAVKVRRNDVLMSATASDNVGVTRVEFWVDGVLRGSDSSVAYTLSLKRNQWPRGSRHSLVAKAFDAAGNVQASTAVSFEI